jgi:ribose transport system permease protein
MRGVSAVGQTFVILTTNIDISVAGVGIVSAIIGALMMTNQITLGMVGPARYLIGLQASPLIALPVMLLVGAGFGAANGMVVSRIRVHGLLVTLAMWQISLAIGYVFTGGTAVLGLPASLDTIGFGRFFGVPLAVIIFFVTAGIAYFVLTYTPFGQSVYATGGNPVMAYLSGVNVRRVLLTVFIISGFCAALAGLLATARLGTAGMSVVGGLELDSIASCAIGGISLAGGRGSIIGVIGGVLIIGTLNNGLSVLGADPSVFGLVKGLVIFTAVAIDYLRRR